MFKEVTDFIHQLYGSDSKIFLHDPYLNGNEKKYLEECIDSTFVSSVGKFVDKFEEVVAEFTGAKKAVVCVNGTSALHMSLMLAGVEKNDEVITQALTFIATCNAITYVGAHPIFIDVDLDTLGLSPGAMKIWLKENTKIINKECFNVKTGRRIKACVPMHTFGHPVHINELIDVCSEYYIEIVEDAAESLGSFYRGKHTGTFGKVGAISFNGNKTITTGGGGMLLFNDENLAKKAKHLTTQAKVTDRWEFIHDEIGYNYRMPNINAAIGCAQMENIHLILNNKRGTAIKYKEFFKNNDSLSFFDEPQNCSSNFWLNVLIAKTEEIQQQFLQYTNDKGVMTRPVWKLMNKLDMFKDCQTGELKNTYWLEKRIVNIPSGVRP